MRRYRSADSSLSARSRARVHVLAPAARRVGLPIVVAGKCSEPVELEYFRTQIVPRPGPDVTIFGTADAKAKRELLSRAGALVFSILWDERFGMVMIEAMACGTPVVALRRGSVPEVVVEGVTGVVCDDPVELPPAITAARRLAPGNCREHVRSRFDVDTMVAGYEVLYRKALLARTPTRPVDIRLPGDRPVVRAPFVTGTAA